MFSDLSTLKILHIVSELLIKGGWGFHDEISIIYPVPSQEKKNLH